MKTFCQSLQYCNVYCESFWPTNTWILTTQCNGHNCYLSTTAQCSNHSVTLWTSITEQPSPIPHIPKICVGENLVFFRIELSAFQTIGFSYCNISGACGECFDVSALSFLLKNNGTQHTHQSFAVAYLGVVHVHWSTGFTLTNCMDWISTPRSWSTSSLIRVCGNAALGTFNYTFISLHKSNVLTNISHKAKSSALCRRNNVTELRSKEELF